MQSAKSWQVASIFLTAFGLRGQKKVCQGESKKTAGFLAQEIRWQPHHWPLSGTASMLLLCLLKDGALIAGSILPQAIDDTHPDVGQGADRRTMGLALGAFALIIVPCPGFLSRRLPGKLVESGAQRLQTGKAFVSFGVVATLKGPRGRARQSLDAAGVGIACSILSPFSQQTRGQALACTWERLPDRLVRMG